MRIATEVDAQGQVSTWRPAEEGEKGELVITQPYPYLARTLWGDAARLGTPEWRGDLERFKAVYFDRWPGQPAYTQGDYARRLDDGAYTLHGRSDDVINVSGHRIGTEEIEGAILRDKTLRQDSPVGNVVVVGAPHDEKGETPVAFLVASPGSRMSDDDLARLQGLVRSEKGATAVPSDFLVVSAFPETRSGKYMRRTLRAILLEQPLGDLSTLRNPAVVKEIQDVVAGWKAFGRLSEARKIVQNWRYLRVETHTIAEGRNVALLVVDNPPVNSLNERSLDELNTVLQQLAQQSDVDALVVTGAGNAFVAGADVKELLEVGEAGDLVSAQTPPNAAQAAFSTLENIGKPVIAAVNGPALGGGNELVLACTYAIADRHARFGQPEINLNLLPGYGGTQRLPRRLFQRGGKERPGASPAPDGERPPSRRRGSTGRGFGRPTGGRRQPGAGRCRHGCVTAVLSRTGSTGGRDDRTSGLSGRQGGQPPAGRGAAGRCAPCPYPGTGQDGGPRSIGGSDSRRRCPRSL